MLCKRPVKYVTGVCLYCLVHMNHISQQWIIANNCGPQSTNVEQSSEYVPVQGKMPLHCSRATAPVLQSEGKPVTAMEHQESPNFSYYTIQLWQSFCSSIAAPLKYVPIKCVEKTCNGALRAGENV